MTPVDVVIVSYNRRDLTLQACDSAAALGPDTRLIVVDNASGDGSAEAVRDRHPTATVLEPGVNLGFGAAVNRGAAAGTAPRILLLNSDATLPEPALLTLAAALDADPRLAAVAPRIRGPGGQVELSAGRRMTVLNEAWFKLLGVLYAEGAGPARRWVERRYGVDADVDSLSAACLLMRREAFSDAGGFDERFFLYAEDVDLCHRWRQDGWRLRFVADAQAEHVRGGSSLTDPLAAERWYRDSQLSYYEKHRSATVVACVRGYLRLRYRLAALSGREDARRMLSWLRGRRREDPDDRPREG